MLIVTAALLVQAVVALFVLVRFGHIEEARAVSAASSAAAGLSAMEGDMLALARRNPRDWVAAQDALDCCGWSVAANADPRIATGGACAAAAANNGTVAVAAERTTS